MRRRHSSAMLLLALVLGLASSSWAQAKDSADEFHWTGRLAAEKVLELRNVNGFIEATGTNADQIEVNAVKSGPDRDQVRVEVKEFGDGVVICAVYPGNSCDPEGGFHSHTRDIHAKVDFTVRLPKNLRFTARNVNGKVDARDMGRYVDASSVNGSVEVSTGSWAKASSVNGSVRVRMGRADWPGALKISSVNGSIEVEVPASLSADVRFHSVNGRLNTDFPLTVQGSFGRRSIEGRIGSGGRELEISTVNGSVDLRKAGL